MLESTNAHVGAFRPDSGPSRTSHFPAWLTETPISTSNTAVPTTEPPSAESVRVTDGFASICDAANWMELDRELVDWFHANCDRLPTEPFGLRPGTHVILPKRFYGSLRADIDVGPEGPRTRRGGLVSDLVDLRRIVEGS
jgi:hypothetical protein